MCCLCFFAPCTLWGSFEFAPKLFLFRAIHYIARSLTLGLPLLFHRVSRLTNCAPFSCPLWLLPPLSFLVLLVCCFLVCACYAVLCCAVLCCAACVAHAGASWRWFLPSDRLLSRPLEHETNRRRLASQQGSFVRSVVLCLFFVFVV